MPIYLCVQVYVYKITLEWTLTGDGGVLAVRIFNIDIMHFADEYLLLSKSEVGLWSKLMPTPALMLHVLLCRVMCKFELHIIPLSSVSIKHAVHR